MAFIRVRYEGGGSEGRLRSGRMLGAKGGPLLIARFMIAMLSFGRVALIVCSVHMSWCYVCQLELNVYRPLHPHSVPFSGTSSRTSF